MAAYCNHEKNKTQWTIHPKAFGISPGISFEKAARPAVTRFTRGINS